MKQTDLRKNHPEKEEEILLAHLCDAAKLAEKRNCEVYTGFLTPAQQIEAKKEVKTAPGIEFELWGGFETAERKMGLFKPDWVQKPDWPIEVLELHTRGEYPSHPEILGALIGLGIRREKIGDILAAAQPPRLICEKTIAAYLTENFTKAGKKSFRTETGTLGMIPEPDFEEKTFTVPSLRLDCIAAEGFGQSRAKTAEAIRKGLAFVNWQGENSPASELKEGDTVSIRGCGRLTLFRIGGTSRKDRIFITVRKFSGK